MNAIAVLLTLLLAAGNPLQPAQPPSIGGGWTLNRELSDAGNRPGRGEPGDGERGRGAGARGRGQGGGRRGGGGFVGGGLGGAGGRGRRGGRGEAREDMARMRDALRDILEPSDHLTITQTGSMIVITGADGRTTRLSPDGSKVKDENTKVERKTRWDGRRLLSEISGAGPGKMTQVFVVDPESHRLQVTVQMEGGRAGQPRTIAHVYDPDAP